MFVLKILTREFPGEIFPGRNTLITPGGSIVILANSAHPALEPSVPRILGQLGTCFVQNLQVDTG